MGASSDRKITLDYDRALQAAGFDHFVRLRFENSRGGESPSHGWVDVHSTFSGGVATDLDVPVTRADRAAVRLICAIAKQYESEPAVFLGKLGAIVTAVWGSDVSEACGNLIGQGVLEAGPESTPEEIAAAEADQIATLNGWISYLIHLGALVGGE